MRGLDRKVALVTGAGSGIGPAIADRLADEGVRVATSDVVGAYAEATARGIADSERREAIAVQLDVADDDSIGLAVAEVSERLGPIDVLVNNAGWDLIEPFVDSERSTWDR